MDRCRFPASPTIALLDLNPNSLAKAAARLRRYAPTCHVGNVLEPVDIGSSGFGSIGLNYLLHCLPGDLKSKCIVFQNMKPLLKDGGVIFGSTILGRGVQHNFMAKKLMRAYNASGIFNNLDDSQEDLEAGLRADFNQCTIVVRGCVALFHAKNQAKALCARHRTLSRLGEATQAPELSCRLAESHARTPSIESPVQFH